MTPGFPAHAGMDPAFTFAEIWSERLPRTRGDGPRPSDDDSRDRPASPHTRGWTLDELYLAGLGGGFPAHAGMDPPSSFRVSFGMRLPRTRGDGPQVVPDRSPHRTASPHTRGWTRRQPRGNQPQQGFPAHAGMDPRRSADTSSATRLPRTRGDGPLAEYAVRQADAASPHTRGWTRRAPASGTSVRGFPAHAGMDPTPCGCATDWRWLPRTRGDGPTRCPGRTCRRSASPHTRGWTQPTGVG